MMSKLLIFNSELTWSARSGVFDWLLGHVADHSGDPLLRDLLYEVVDNNLGSLEFAELSPGQRARFADVTRRLVLEDARTEFGRREEVDVVTPQIEDLASLLSSLKDTDIQPLT
jgi:hypothetical protein